MAATETPAPAGGSREPAPPAQERPSRTERWRAMEELRVQFPPLALAVREDTRIACRAEGRATRLDSKPAILWHAARLAVTRPGFRGLLLYRCKTRLQVHGLLGLASVLHRLAMMSGVCIGDPVVLEAGVHLPGGHVVIDGLVVIARGVEVGPRVTIGLKEGNVRGATIEEGVRIEDGAKIIGQVHLGAGAVVEAGSVVVRDVPPGATVAGVPARPTDE